MPPIPAEQQSPYGDKTAARAVYARVSDAGPREAAQPRGLPPQIAYSIGEVSDLTGVGRTTVFAEIKAGRLLVRKLGRRTLILDEDLRAWLAALPSRAA